MIERYGTKTHQRGWHGVAALVVALTVLTTGCTMGVPEFKVRETASYPSTSEKDGLVIAVHPTIDAGEMEETFRINLVEKGLLPVLVVADNRSATRSFILATENIRLAERGLDQANDGRRSPVTSEGPGMGLTTAGAFAPLVPVLLPLLIVGVKMVSDAQVIEHNVADKAFYSRTLDPGQKAFGYLYMTLPKEARPGGSYDLTLRALDAADGRETTFVVPIEYKAR